jgi:hypothetical protein
LVSASSDQVKSKVDDSPVTIAGTSNWILALLFIKFYWIWVLHIEAVF